MITMCVYIHKELLSMSALPHGAQGLRVSLVIINLVVVLTGELQVFISFNG